MNAKKTARRKAILDGIMESLKHDEVFDRVKYKQKTESELQNRMAVPLNRTVAKLFEEYKGYNHDRAVSEAPLDKIQNVSYEIEGPYQTFLDYGMVRILTAGQKDADVEFRFVHHPYDVQQEITDASHTYGNVVVEAQELENKKNYVS